MDLRRGIPGGLGKFVALQRTFNSINRRIRGLSRRVSALEKKRGGWTPISFWILFIAFVGALGLATIDMRVDHGGRVNLFHGKDNITKQMSLFKLPQDGCRTGVTVVKRCHKVDKDIQKDLAETDCGSTWMDFRLRYQRCQIAQRARRVAREAPKQDFLAEVEMVAFRALRDNKGILAVGLLCVAIAKRWPIWTWATVRGEYVEPLYVLKSEKMTLLQTTLRPDEGYVTSTTNGLLEFKTGRAYIYGDQVVRMLATDCEVNGTYSTDICPGGSQLAMSDIQAAGRTCVTEPYNRGWGTGCFKWGAGFVATCVELDCATFISVSSVARSTIKMNVTATSR